MPANIVVDETRLSGVARFVVVNDVWHRRGGLTRNALHKGRLMAARLGSPTTIVTVDFNPDLDYSKQRLAEMGLVDESLVIRNLFEDAGVYGGDPMTFFLDGASERGFDQAWDEIHVAEPDIEGLQHQEESDLDERLTVTYTDPTGAPVVRFHRNMAGDVRREDVFDTAGNFVARRRLFDPAGRCRVEFRSRGKGYLVRFFDDAGVTGRSFTSQVAMRTAYFDHLAAETEESIFQVETETSLLARAVLAMKAPGVAKVAMLHSSHLDFPHTAGSHPLSEHDAMLQELDRYDAYVLITPEHMDDIAEMYGSRTTLHAVPHAAIPCPHEEETDRDPMLAVGVGRYVDRKNWEHVIRAFIAVHREVPEARFELWGMGPKEDEYRELIRESSLEGVVRIMGMTSDPAAVFRRASFSILAGIREGFPLVLLESMAAGTPAVAYDGKYGPKDIIRDSEDGLLVPYGDEQALADGIIALFRRPGRARSLGTRATEVVTRFSDERCADGWVGVYLSALEQRDMRVTLPELAAEVAGVRATPEGLRVDMSVTGEWGLPHPDVVLHLRSRSVGRMARQVPCEVQVIGDALTCRAVIDENVLTSMAEVTDAYLGIGIRNAHRFLRVALAETVETSAAHGIEAYRTNKGNLSLRPRSTKTGSRAAASAGPVRRSRHARRLRRVAGSAVRLASLVARVSMENLRRPLVRRRASYARKYLHLPVDPRVVLFETTLDDAVKCNPGALFSSMLSDGRFAAYRFVWAIGDKSSLRAARREWPSRNVVFVRRGSAAHLRYLASAGYLITNGTLPRYFQRKPGQVVLNTWHGVPLKRMGFETPTGRFETRNVLRTLCQTDYVVSGSDYETQALFLRGHKLQGVFAGAVIDEGHPRVDVLFTRTREECLTALASHGLKLDPGKKTILYAPTWRGERVSTPRDTVEEMARLAHAMRAKLDTEQYTVLFKLHPLTAAHLDADDRFAGMLVPGQIDTNLLLGAVDVLITDFSSIFIDFLVTRRPIIFFIDDLEGYIAERGIYLAPDELPGPVTSSPDELADLVARTEPVDPVYAERYESMIEWLCPREDGKASARVIEAVFGDPSGLRVQRDFDRTDRVKLLLHVGRFARDYRSRAVLALLKRIDHERFDVSIFLNSGDDESRLANLDRLPHEVRSFLRIGTVNATFLERYRWEAFATLARRSVFGRKVYPARLARREFERVFGECRFDVALDLIGTSPVPASLVAESGAERRFTIMRDDLPKVSRKQQKRVRNFADRFSAVLSLDESPFVRMVDPDLIAQDAAAYPVEVREGIRVLAIDDQEYPLPEDQAMTFVSATTRWKDQKRLLDAFRLAHSERPDIRLVILTDRAGVGRAERFCNEAGLSGPVSAISCASKLAYMAQCGCYVAPACTKRVPIALLGAAALGMRTIVVESDAVRDLFGGTGRLVPDSVPAMARAMVEHADGRLLQTPVDFEPYNSAAMEAFYRLCAPGA